MDDSLCAVDAVSIEEVGVLVVVECVVSIEFPICQQVHVVRVSLE